MTRFLGLFLALVLVLSLAGCGGSDDMNMKSKAQRSSDGANTPVVTEQAEKK